MIFSGFGGDYFNCGMLCMEVVVISGWVGLGQKALCGDGKIPSGSLGMWLFTISILQVELGGGGVVVWGGLALWLREGYGGRLLFWYGGRFNSIRGTVDLLWPEVGLWEVGLIVHKVL